MSTSLCGTCRSTALALLIEGRGVLVGGDILSDVSIPMLDDFNGTNDPIRDYLIGLRLLEGVADDVDVLIPVMGQSAEVIRSVHDRPGWRVRASLA